MLLPKEILPFRHQIEECLLGLHSSMSIETVFGILEQKNQKVHNDAISKHIQFTNITDSSR